MKDFIAIDFETANPKRVSACAIGYAKVSDGAIIETNGHLIKPVGGHAPFQSKIHGIKEEHTSDKPEFCDLFYEIKDIFNYPLVGHSLFDKQVLNALSDHFGLKLTFDYTDSSAVAREKLPDLKNHKLKTLARHFKLPKFRHHDATEDAKACANILLRLQYDCPDGKSRGLQYDILEFSGLVRGILADDEVNYKEAFELLYWLEDHTELSGQLQHLYLKTKEVLDDDHLDYIEAVEIKKLLEETLLQLM
jgi:DNA polymerase-3 subunit epsilon